MTTSARPVAQGDNATAVPIHWLARGEHELPDDTSWLTPREAARAAGMRFSKRRKEYLLRRVLGLSMGGEEAIGAAAADPIIAAVVAEGATHRTAADKSGYLPGGIAGAIQRGLDRLTYRTAGLLSQAPEPATLHSAIARADSTPFLLIAAGQGIDEPEAVAFLRDAAPARVQTWTVPGATHVHGLVTAPAGWTTVVTTFLDRALGTSGSR
jgi:hypothetical protein